MVKPHFYLLFILLSVFLRADILKENFITFDINQSKPTLLLDFESDNLTKFIALDDSHNDIISWKELKAHRSEITAFVLKHLSIMSDNQTCPMQITDYEVYRRVHQSYIKLPITLDCPAPKKSLTLDYTLFFDVDKAQQLFVKLYQQSKPKIVSFRHPTVQFTLQESSLWESFREFVQEGIWHIWMGFDHILFLLMLLIPSVYYYHDRVPYPRERFSSVLKEIVKITTAFTLAHSLTLALSLTNILNPPSYYIEIAIALSVLFTALNNLFLFTRIKTWALAFGFGLIHGFGFANVLHELITKKSGFAAMLVGFNLGVEIGQLVIVLALLPLLYLLRKSRFYRYAIMIGISTITAIIALLWAIERAFNLSILPW